MSISVGKIADAVRARKITDPIIVQVTNVQSIEKPQNIVKAKIHDGKYQITTIFKVKDADTLKKLKEFILIKIVQGTVHVPQNATKTLVVAISNFEVVDSTVKSLIIKEPLIKLEHLEQVGNAPVVRPNQPISHQPAAPADLSKGKITPFSMLTTYSKAIIKGRVITKNDKFKYSKGELFNFVLQDKDGTELKATCFNDTCNEKFEEIQVGSTYYINKADFKQSNGKGFRSSKMIDLDMLITKYTVIQKTDDAVPEISSITPISDLKDSPVDATYDICAFLLQKGEEQSLRNEKAKITLTFVDQSNYAVEVDFWNEDIEKSKEMEVGNIYILTSLRLKEFRYKNLTVTKATQIKSGKEIEKHDETSLVNKYIQERTTEEGITVADLIYISNETKLDAPTGDVKQADQLLSFRELQNRILETDAEVKANVYGYFTMFKVDSGFCYSSCPSCKKKVDAGEGSYCSKCNKKVSPIRRYIVKASIADSTNSTWVTIFDEEMKKLIGKSADDMFKLNEDNAEQFESEFKDLTFVECRFHVNGKREEYNGETRAKLTVTFTQVLDTIAFGTEEMKALQRMASDMKTAICSSE